MTEEDGWRGVVSHHTPQYNSDLGSFEFAKEELRRFRALPVDAGIPVSVSNSDPSGLFVFTVFHLLKLFQQIITLQYRS